jgi:hypothetical protein
MASWATDFKLHPWFKMSSLKRPLSSNDHESDDETISSSLIHFPPNFPRVQDAQGPVRHPRKRLKSSGLEGGLASLSLLPPSFSQPTLVVQSAAMPFAVHSASPRRNSDMDVEEPALPPPSLDIEYVVHDGLASVLQASAVEEPSHPSLSITPEVRMRARSWYEPTPDRKHSLAPFLFDTDLLKPSSRHHRHRPRRFRRGGRRYTRAATRAPLRVGHAACTYRPIACIPY